MYMYICICMSVGQFSLGVAKRSNRQLESHITQRGFVFFSFFFFFFRFILFHTLLFIKLFTFVYFIWVIKGKIWMIFLIFSIYIYIYINACFRPTYEFVLYLFQRFHSFFYDLWIVRFLYIYIYIYISAWTSTRWGPVEPMELSMARTFWSNSVNILSLSRSKTIFYIYYLL